MSRPSELQVAARILHSFGDVNAADTHEAVLDFDLTFADLQRSRLDESAHAAVLGLVAAALEYARVSGADPLATLMQFLAPLCPAGVKPEDLHAMMSLQRRWLSETLPTN